MNFTDEQTIDRGLYLVAGLIFGAVGGYLAHQPPPAPPVPSEAMGVVIESRRTVGQASKELDRCLAVNHACLRLLLAVEVQALAADGGQ